MKSVSLRLAGLIGVLAIVAAACADSGASDGASIGDEPTTTAGTETSSTTSPAPDAVSAGLPTDVDSALYNDYSADFGDPLIDPGAIISGGPPPDGIPPIDDPQFVTVDEADIYLQDGEPVVVLEIDGDARAYPVQVMIWHEIVNDTVGGVPVSVTYCPLCNSAVTYERRIRGEVTTFGTSGRLFNSALVMYDRATESLWTHFDGRAVVGALAGEELPPIGSPLLSWADFKATYPDGKVLDREETGHARDYGRNPYVGYDNPDGDAFLFTGALDDRARELQRVVGVTVGDESLAYSLEVVTDELGASVTTLELGGTSLVILWKAGQATALEGSGVDAGRDVGSVGVFAPVVDGQRLTFSVVGDGFVDAETGSTWTVAGLATDGALAGESLDRIPHLDTFWFAWSTYRPGTLLIEE